MNKPSKVLIIGSGQIVIGQACCHSEGAERLKNLSFSEHIETLRFAQGDRWSGQCRKTLRCAQGDSKGAQGDREGAQGDNRMTRGGLQYMSGVSRTERWLSTMSI